MRALVTGGTGFVGGHTARVLAEAGHRVSVFTRRPALPERLARLGVEAVRGDLEDLDSVARALEGSAVVFHAGELKNTTKAASRKNLRAVERIVEKAPACGVRRLVFVSSITVAGIPPLAEAPASEETAPEVELGDHYTWYKREAEALLAQGAGGLEWSVIRPAPVYGPGSRFMGRLVDAVDRLGPVGFPFVGKGENLAPLVHVKDLAMAIALAGEAPGAAGQAFNLTDGERHTWAEFLEAIAGALGKKIRIIPVPPLALRLPSVFLDYFSFPLGLELDLTHYTDYFSRDIFFSNDKARQALGWRPAYGLREGVAEMISEDG
ncbi:MAG: NAD-dependent epimerase/dehydratase family protein [Thermodesulfovibrionales bacterium]